MKKLFRSIIDHIDDKFNFCEHCKYVRHELNDFAGDYNECCGVNHCSDMTIHWFCIMPNFIKKIVYKYYTNKEYKSWQKYTEETSNDK